MSQRKWILPVGMGVIFLLILVLPVLLASTPQPHKALSQPITGPQAATGAAQHLTWWNMLLAGLALGVAIGIGITGALLRKAGVIAVSPRFKLLMILGAITLAIYVLTFLLPYPLHRYYNFKGISFGVIAERDPGVALSLSAATIALFLLYYVAYRLCRGQTDRRLLATVLLGAALFALATALVSLITSLDIYDYIARGRITGIYNGNPYVQTPNDYADPFMDYASWKDKTAAYGPVWEVLSGFISRLAGDRLWPNMVIHKGLALASYFACVLIVAALLQRVAPNQALSGTLLFAWNPLILLEGVANGHNDLLMMALILGALWALIQTEHADEEPSSNDIRCLAYGAFGIVLLWLAVLIKFVPILLVPLFLVYLLVKEKSWRGRIELGLFLLALLALVTFQYYRIFWQWPEVSYTITRRGEMFRMSVPSVILAQMKQNMENLTFLRAIANRVAVFQAPSAQQVGPLEVAQAIAGWPFLAAFALTYPIVLTRTVYRLYKKNRQAQPPTPQGSRGKIRRFILGRQDANEKRPWQILVEASLNIFLLYLLLANFWFWPWYLIWPIALLTLSGNKRLMIPLALASCAGELSHVGWNFVWYWWGVSWDTLYQLEEIVVICMYAPALLWYVVANYRAASARLQLRQQPADTPEIR
jgi:alpha-1,6-mannosyltransferase